MTARRAGLLFSILVAVTAIALLLTVAMDWQSVGATMSQLGVTVVCAAGFMFGLAALQVWISKSAPPDEP